jgi:hypothetical protein
VWFYFKVRVPMTNFLVQCTAFPAGKRGGEYKRSGPSNGFSRNQGSGTRVQFVYENTKLIYSHYQSFEALHVKSRANSTRFITAIHKFLLHIYKKKIYVAEISVQAENISCILSGWNRAIMFLLCIVSIS